MQFTFGKKNLYFESKQTKSPRQKIRISFDLRRHNIPDLKHFEDDLQKLIENIEFHNVRNHFQETLANDLKKIKSSLNVFVFADKTRNIYETPT